MLHWHLLMPLHFCSYVHIIFSPCSHNVPSQPSLLWPQSNYCVVCLCFIILYVDCLSHRGKYKAISQSSGQTMPLWSQTPICWSDNGNIWCADMSIYSSSTKTVHPDCSMFQSTVLKWTKKEKRANHFSLESHVRYAADTHTSHGQSLLSEDMYTHSQLEIHTKSLY